MERDLVQKDANLFELAGNFEGACVDGPEPRIADKLACDMPGG